MNITFKLHAHAFSLNSQTTAYFIKIIFQSQLNLPTFSCFKPLPISQTAHFEIRSSLASCMSEDACGECIKVGRWYLEVRNKCFNVLNVQL